MARKKLSVRPASEVGSPLPYSANEREMNNAVSAFTVANLHDPCRRDRLLAAAPRLARLLLQLEEEAYADARPCPFCYATEAASGCLPHAIDCELDEVLFDAGLRLGAPLES